MKANHIEISLSKNLIKIDNSEVEIRSSEKLGRILDPDAILLESINISDPTQVERVETENLINKYK